MGLRACFMILGVLRRRRERDGKVAGEHWHSLQVRFIVTRHAGDSGVKLSDERRVTA